MSNFKYFKEQLTQRDDPILKQVLKYEEPENREEFSKELIALCEMMGGVGLSASQVGNPTRAFCVTMGDFKETFFNPQITTYSESSNNFTEGCLTYPGIFIDIKRPDSVMLKYINVQGEEKQVMFNGITARIVQHEYDHMEGRNFLAHASKLKKDRAIKKAEKAGYKYKFL